MVAVDPATRRRAAMLDGHMTPPVPGGRPAAPGSPTNALGVHLTDDVERTIRVEGFTVSDASPSTATADPTSSHSLSRRRVNQR